MIDAGQTLPAVQPYFPVGEPPCASEIVDDSVDVVVDPSTVYVERDVWTENDEDEDWTAADVMETMSGPGLVASTYQ